MNRTTPLLVSLLLHGRGSLRRPSAVALSSNGVPSHAETEPDHRHVSHLVFAYPGSTPLPGDMGTAVGTTLDRRGDDSTGWSLIWKLCLRARLREPERVVDLLRLIFRPVATTAVEPSGGLYQNLFAAHPPFQVDGNLRFIAAVTEMLLQSHAGEIRVLPALPAEFAAGSVSGLVARPGITVDVRWEQGSVVELSLTPRKAAASRAHGVHRRMDPFGGVAVRLLHATCRCRGRVPRFVYRCTRRGFRGIARARGSK